MKKTATLRQFRLNLIGVMFGVTACATILTDFLSDGNMKIISIGIWAMAVLAVIYSIYMIYDFIKFCRN